MDRTPSGLTRFGRRGAFWLLITGCAAAGVGGLATAVGWPIALGGALVALLAGFARFNEVAGRIVGAIVVGTLVLVGVNVGVDNALDAIGWGRPAILAGLGFAVVVFALAAGWYLRGDEEPRAPARRGRAALLGRGSHWGFWTTAVTAVALSIFLLVDLPIIVHSVVTDDAVPVVPIVVGVAPALLLCGLGWWCRRKREGLPVVRRIGGIAAPVVGLAVLAVAPVVAQLERDRGRKVPDRAQVASKVDVRIVTDGSSHPPPGEVEPDPALAGFDVRYSVGFAEGGGVQWTLVGGADAGDALRVASRGRRARPVQGRPARRRTADSVLLLLPDGTPPVVDGRPENLPDVLGSPAAEVGRWRRIARAGREPGMPTFALLQTKRSRQGRARLDRWRLFSRTGGVVSLQLDGHRAVTDTALALAIGAPSARADLALAIKHRPVLLFDRTEPVPRPLSVDWLFRTGQVLLCRDRGVSKSDCDEQPTTDPGQLASDVAHLQLRRPAHELLKRLARQEAALGPRMLAATAALGLGSPPPAAPAAAPQQSPDASETPETAIYVHPVPVQQGGRDLLYLDYWWYLPDNPVTVGLKAFCGAGLVIPGVTCHDHQSDWEGMTVVVDRTTGRVTSVHYAQHNDVVRFGWEQLRARWDRDPAIRRTVSGAENGRQRPLAFVASGTHATYPLPCPRRCRQFAHATGEDRHGGELPWIGNFTNVCGARSCVHRLPTSEGGRTPALWNAFTGPWGKKSCALSYFCDSAEPPSAPGSQKRYQHPTRCTGFADPAWKFKREPCA